MNLYGIYEIIKYLIKNIKKDKEKDDDILFIIDNYQINDNFLSKLNKILLTIFIVYLVYH